ncbi:MAG: outer membrane beta-barrel protein [Flavobacteriales bacterium]|nr:outer membrane beta-barrel protein [Flavobacteriales bacterium]
MKIKAITALAFMSCPFAIQAQDEPKGYLGLGFGVASPLGEFRSTEGKSAGYASDGAAFQLEFGYLLGKHFGVAAMVRGTGNATSDKALTADFNNSLGGLDLKVEPGLWVTGSLLVGGMGAFPLNEKWSFTSRLLVGFASVSSPTLKVSTGDGNLLVKQEEGLASAPTYMLALGFKVDLSERFCLLVGVDYQGMDADFSGVKIDGPSGRSTTSFKQAISIASLGVTAGYRL